MAILSAPEAPGNAGLTPSERHALRRITREHGRRWKSALQQMWETGNYGGTKASATVLQGLRNRIGPSGLHRIKAADLAEGGVS